MLTGISQEQCRVWLMASDHDTPETLAAELASSRLGHNLLCLPGPGELKQRLSQLGEGGVLADRSELHMLLLTLEDSDSLCDLMGWVRSTPGLQALPVIVLASDGHSLDLRRVYGSGINSVVRLPRDRADRLQVLEVLAGYWLDVLPLARSLP